MTRKQKRLSVIGGALLFLGVASGLTLFFYALGSKASFFLPADGCGAKRVSPRASAFAWRARGRRAPLSAGKAWRWSLLSRTRSRRSKVVYNGILPDLFREAAGRGHRRRIRRRRDFHGGHGAGAP